MMRRHYRKIFLSFLLLLLFTGIMPLTAAQVSLVYLEAPAIQLPIGNNLVGARIDWRDDGRLMAVANGASVQVLTADNQLLNRLTGFPQTVTDVEWNAMGDKLAVAVGFNIQIWSQPESSSNAQLEVNLQAPPEGSPYGIISVDWNTDSSQIIAVVPPRAYIWDSQGSLTPIRTFIPNPTPLIAAAWNPLGDKVALANITGTIVVEDLGTGSKEYADVQEQAAVYSLAWSANGEQLAAGTGNNSIEIFSLEWTLLSKSIIDTQTPIVHSLEWHPTLDNLLASGGDGIINIWDTSSESSLKEVQTSGVVSSISWSPDDGNQLAYGGSGGEIHILSVADLNLAGAVISVAWSPDGSRIAGSGENGLLRIWDTSGHTILNITGLTGRIKSVTWSPDSSKIVSGSDDGMIRFWDAQTGRQLAVIQAHDDVVQSVDWSPDGTKVLTASFNDQFALRIWDAKTYELLASDDSGRLFEARWSPDGTHIAVANENHNANIYGIDLGRPTGPAEIEAAVLAIDWSPDGKKLAGGSGQGLIHLWDTTTYEQILLLTGHADRIEAVAFSPNGQMLASAGFDGTLRIWDVVTGQLLATYQKPAIFTTSITWSPDGTQLAYGGSGGEVHILSVADLNLLGVTVTPDAESRPATP